MGAKLYFKNPIFKEGRNISVRRGVKWDVGDKKNIGFADVDTDQLLFVKDIETYCVPFWDIRDDQLRDEHDPVCRDYQGLLKCMREIYPGFTDIEVVTVVSWELSPQDVELGGLKIG